MSMNQSDYAQAMAEVIRELLEISKSDAWNGSYRLDDALTDARELLEQFDARPALHLAQPGCIEEG